MRLFAKILIKKQCAKKDIGNKFAGKLVLVCLLYGINSTMCLFNNNITTNVLISIKNQMFEHFFGKLDKKIRIKVHRQI